MKHLITLLVATFLFSVSFGQTAPKKPVTKKQTATKQTTTKQPVTKPSVVKPELTKQTPIKKESVQETEWEYKTFTKNFAGEVLSFEPAGGVCETVAYASICIIQLEEGEIIRVLTMCNTKNNLKKGDEVIVAPQERPTTSVSASSASDTYDHIRLTTYGSITKFE